MIIVTIIGGLGNQLFQYAAGRAVALKHNTRLRLDLSGFPHYPRPYLLDHFQIEAREASPAELQLAAGGGTVGTPMRKIVEHGQSFHPEVLESGPHLFLQGYWQSPRYFEAVAAQIRADLRLRQPLSPAALATASSLAEPGSVALHIRRGDYVTHPGAHQVHGVTGLDYYQRAMAEIETRIAFPRYFVFSDDLPWAKEHLHSPHPLRFIDPHDSASDSSRDYEDLILMSQCHHQIVANSTFSWWAAWLNPRPDKQIIAPTRWFANRPEPEGLIPLEWTRL